MRVALLLALVACGGKSEPPANRGSGSAEPRPAPPTKPTQARGQAPDACACAPGEQCVQRFDGNCNGRTECVARVAGCSAGASPCTKACATAYCPMPYQCENRPPCGGEDATAFTCYGP